MNVPTQLLSRILIAASLPLAAPLELDAQPPSNALVVLTFNTGTTLGLPHDQNSDDQGPDAHYRLADAQRSDRWYGNGLAWRPAIDATRQMIARIDPDIVAFQEVFDCQECEPIPREHRRGFVCENWQPGDPDVARQVLGTQYQIAYHPGKRSKCLAVHRRFGTLRGGDGNHCDGALDGATVEGCGSGARVARGIIDRPDGTTLTVISLHGTSGFLPADQQCRVRQVERVFVDWGDGRPGVQGDRNLILGDFNTDPGRAAAWDRSAARWLDFVGADKPFRFVSRIGPESPRSYRGLGDIDHVVSDAYQGTCQYLGVDPDSAPVWKETYFDHVPVVCRLRER
jgi:endonuclease/exonuclease/phosphatase family metal-dependent hydrolase